MERAERFAENYRILAKKYPFEYRLLHALVAFFYAEKDRTVDIAALESARTLLRANSGPFSGFRSAVQLIYAGSLSLEPDPQAAFDRVLAAYHALRETFPSSNYLPIAAFAMARVAEESSFASLAASSRAIFDTMRQDHPFLTGREDVPFAALFACGGASPRAASAATESAFTVLRERFGRTDAVQTVSHMLSLVGDPVTGARQVEELWLDLRDRRYGRDLELLGLAAMALSGRGDAGAVRNIDDALRHCKGMGNWTLGARPRMMYAALLASASDGDNAPLPVTVTLVAATVGMITREQAAATAVTVS